MEKTKNLDFDVTTSATIIDDEIDDTIIGYGENFAKIDELLDNLFSMDDLVSGQYYVLGKKYWNNTPTIDNYIGWVNVRAGLYAKPREPQKNYQLGDYVVAVPSDNGNVYECIANGRSTTMTPTFLTANGSEFYDASGSDWVANFNYDVDDVVFSTDGSKLFYYTCVNAGLSDIVEPIWTNAVTGATFIDGSVTWRKEKTVKWKQIDTSCNFRPFGKIE